MATVQNQKTYESWYDSFEGLQEGKFMTWYHSYQGKKIVNIVYSVGASVVIIGALFKILHWPGASGVLMVGMFTEAFLFMIGCLEAPHEEFHWANVFPELLEYGSPDERVARSREQIGLSGMANRGGAGAGAAAGGAGGAGGAVSTGVAFSDKEMEAVKNSMNDLVKATTQLSEIGKLATTSSKLGEKMEAASEAADKYAQSALALGEKSTIVGEAYTTIAANMKNAVEGTKAYEKEVGDLSKKLGALNSVYELQLNAVQTQSESVQAQTEAYKTQASEIAAATQKIQAVGTNFAKMEASLQESLKTQETFDAAQRKLAQQVADLNKIYGNMLNALA